MGHLKDVVVQVVHPIFKVLQVFEELRDIKFENFYKYLVAGFSSRNFNGFLASYREPWASFHSSHRKKVGIVRLRSPNAISYQMSLTSSGLVEKNVKI